MKELQNNLSHLIRVFLHPMLVSNSMASIASAEEGLWQIRGGHCLVEYRGKKRLAVRK